MTVNDLPNPPTFAELQAWAGPGRVVRARRSDVTPWQLPERQKNALVSSGVPLLDGVIDEVRFGSTSSHYHLAGYGRDSPYGSIYAVEPATGHVVHLGMSSGEASFVNSTVHHWLLSLHLVGTWLATSTAIHRWDEDAMLEAAALEELGNLLKQIALLDPPAYGDIGDHETLFWPGLLDRWLY